MPLQRRYWDSCAFLGWLAQEADKVGDCEGVIRGAEAGNVQIVTSSWTLVEVIKIKGQRPLPATVDSTIREFFKHEWIIVRQLDRVTAEDARELVWKYGFSATDSVHVASAVRAHLNQMDTFDDGLIRRSGEIGSLVISRPNLPLQLELDLLENANDTESEDTESETIGRPQASQSDAGGA